MKRVIIAWVLLCLASCAVAAGEESTRTNASFNVRVWDTDDGLPQSTVLALAQTPDGYLWVGTLNGLARFDGLRFDVFNSGNTPALEDSSIRKLAVDSSGTLWITTESGGTVELRDGKFSTATNTFPNSAASPAERVEAFWRTNRFAERFDNKPWGWRAPHDVAADRDGNLVVGTQFGAFWLYRDRRIVQLSKENGLSGNVVMSALFDREGTLWLGTDGGGLNRFPRTFALVPEVRGRTINSVARTSDGTVWVATTGEGLVSMNGGMVRSLGPFFVAEPNWRVVFADRRDRLRVGGDIGSGLWRYEQQFQPDIRVPQVAIRAIHEDRAGFLWVGSEIGLFRLSETNTAVFTTTNGLSSAAITAIHEDAESTLWIGTRRGGINRLRDGKLSALRKAEGAPSDDIAALAIDVDGTIWVTTPANGLARFRNARWTYYTTREGLPSDSLSYLLDDAHGNLWIGSATGLLRIPKSALNDFADGKISSVPCRVFGKADGLPTAECSPAAQPGALRDPDGTLWFPTIKGLAFVNAADVHPNRVPPPIALQSVLIDNRPRSVSANVERDTITLAPRDNRLEIHYASLNLAAPERALFRYRLEGLEKNWVDAGNSRVATYNKIPPGRYTFHVIAGNEDGVWNETGRTLGIIVQPPFWRTWWFVGLVSALLLAAIAGTVHYFSTQRLQRELAAMRQQEALEKERARIARDIHDQVGASLTQVALLGELVETDKDSPADIEDHAKQISQTARDTTRALDEIVWTVNPQNDTLEGLVNYICKYAQDYLAVAGIKYRLDVPSALPVMPIPPDVRHNVFLAAKEAITNIVRHAKASAASVRMQLRDSVFAIEIEDNGRGLSGMDPQRAKTRHGLSNMRKRMEDIGGEFVLEPAGEVGARVRLAVRLNSRTTKA